MQQKNKKGIACIILLAVTSTLLFSFSSPGGGDSFEIYVNGKMVVQQYLAQKKAAPTLDWSRLHASDKVEVYYSHCGVAGKKRSILLKDAQNKVVKNWTFADVSGKDNGMSCLVKDITGAGKTCKTVYLYYASQEVPGGHLLATIQLS